jgi:hypothetical protein
MNQLLSIARINDSELKSILIRIRGGELLRLSEPCYYPNLGKFDLQLIHATGLNEQDIKDFVERTWRGRPQEKLKSFRDASFLVWLMWYCLTQNDVPGFKSVLIYQMIKQYRKLYKRYFRTICNLNVFILALNRLSKSHLFSGEGAIPGAISYLSNDLAQKFEQGIKDWDLDEISKCIAESRSRLNQSFRTFANLYYAILKTPGEYRIPSTQVNSPIPTLREEVLQYVATQICMGGYKDQQAIDEAKKNTKISGSMAIALVDELSNGTTSTRYFDILKYILTTLLASPLSALIDDIVTRLMSIKRTTKSVSFKKEIQDLTSVLAENSGRKQEFRSLTPQTQFRVSKFLAYYIARVLRNIFLQLKQSGSL